MHILEKNLFIVSLRTKCNWALTLQNLCPGRRLFRQRQLQLMEKSQPLRGSLAACYLDFLADAFSQSHLSEAMATPNAERFSTAQPGGLPWRLNLSDKGGLGQALSPDKRLPMASAGTRDKWNEIRACDGLDRP